MKQDGNDLFMGQNGLNQPLAARMRPRNLDEYIGQEHILGPGRLLRRAIRADQLSSIILSGPPGTGKTTLAMVIANSTRSSFQSMNAVLSGVAELRAAIDTAKSQKQLYDRRTILFVDEVHRWNKAQQDALLPWVENGTVILIGATTENPWFEVNPALVSRSRVFQLVSLTDSDLDRIIDQALADPVRGYGKYLVALEPAARRHLIKTSGGDARTLLNALELAVESGPDSFPPPTGSSITVDLAAAEDSIQSKAILYDPDGDYHFDTISAFIKSVRGSDPDAALYWLARMVKGGESPRFIFRRLLVLAAEDIGLADPGALQRVEAAAAAFERTGLPEGQFFLAQTTLDLCLCPKSNSVMGYFDALEAVSQEHRDVPDHLKDASRDGPALGHGKHYQYPHAWKDHWVAQHYLPHSLKGKVFYQPGFLGWEGAQAAAVLDRRSIQLAEAGDHGAQEIRTASPPDRGVEHFLRRSSQSTEPVLLKLRDRMIELLSPLPHHRMGVAGDESGFLLPALGARIPDGCLLLWASPDGLDRFNLLLKGLEQSRSSRMDSPDFWHGQAWDQATATTDPLPCPEGGLSFRLIEQDPGRLGALARLCQCNPPMPRPWVFAELLGSRSLGFAEFLPETFLGTPLGKKVREIETTRRASLARREQHDQTLISQGWTVIASEIVSLERRRLIGIREIETWLGTGHSGLGADLASGLTPDELAELSAVLKQHCLDSQVSRTSHFMLLQARPSNG